MKVKVILNPYANRWHAGDRQEMVQAAFTAVNVTADFHITQGPGEGTAAAETAVGHYDAVVAAGGDGTINEVVNGLIRAAGDGPTIPFGIMPIGTANDLGDTTGIPRDLVAAAEVIAAGQTWQIDAGRVNDHYFDNNCALGMEPLVTLENTKIKRLSGELRYFVALVRALLKLQAWHMQISWDDSSYDGPAILLSVCNGPRTGGLFQIAPQAKFDDGLFDYVFAPDLPKRTVLAILPRLFKGSHIDHSDVVYGRSRRISVKSNPGTPIHADGELIADALTSIEYELLPGKISLLTLAQI
ncbi:MAG: diacylglycerol kinase family lipid kinase [Chloroflexi bacterium]|nr:diacylglycerol kinase family lipid kinase [Chloroflexota bacterium]